MSLCVLVPAYNEELGLGGTISSILRAGVDVADIYVVDDCSPDTTSAVAASFGVNLLRNVANLGKAKSLHAAFAHFNLARYQHIALMDADTSVAVNYYREIETTFTAHPKASIVFGCVKNRPHGWIAARRCADYWIGQKIWKETQSMYSVVTVCPGCASVYKTDVFASLDWIKAASTQVEDCYVTIEANRKGLKSVYCPTAHVITQDPKTFHDFWFQQKRWNTGLFTVAARLKMWRGVKPIDLEFKMLALEGIFFSAAVLLFPIWIFYWTPALWCLSLDILCMFLVALIVSIVERRIDVLLYSPLFLVLRLTDCANFLYSFGTVMLGQKENDWFHPKRYKELS